MKGVPDRVLDRVMSCIYQADGSDRNAARTLEEAKGRELGVGTEPDIDEPGAAILSVSCQIPYL
jgi:hypothetical protein